MRAMTGTGEAKRRLLPNGAGLGSDDETHYGGTSARLVVASAPAAEKLSSQVAAASNEVSILPANVQSRDEIASLVNNYRVTHGVSTAPPNTLRRWNAGDYVSLLVPKWLFCCACYGNTPTSVQFISDMRGEVVADTAVLGMVTGLTDRSLGQLDLRALTTKNHYVNFGNVHVVYVPQGMYAKAIINNKYWFLDAGWHVYVAPQFINEGLTATSEDVIKHRNTHIFNVVPGKVVVVSDTSKPDQPIEILQPGQAVRTSHNLRYTSLNVAMQQMRVEETVVTSDNYRLQIKGFISFRIQNSQRLVDTAGFRLDLQQYVNGLLQQYVQAAFNHAGSRVAYRSTIQHNLGSALGEEEVIAREAPRLAEHVAAKEGEADEVKSQIHDDIARELARELGTLGIECTGVKFTEFMPDAPTVQMLEENNKLVVSGMSSVEVATLAQRAKNKEAEGEAQRTQIAARAAAEARQINAEAEARAVQTVAAAWRENPEYAATRSAVAVAEAYGGRLTIFGGATAAEVMKATLAANGASSVGLENKK